MHRLCMVIIILYGCLVFLVHGTGLEFTMYTLTYRRVHSSPSLYTINHLWKEEWLSIHIKLTYSCSMGRAHTLYQTLNWYNGVYTVSCKLDAAGLFLEVLLKTNLLITFNHRIWHLSFRSFDGFHWIEMCFDWLWLSVQWGCDTFRSRRNT